MSWSDEQLNLLRSLWPQESLTQANISAILNEKFGTHYCRQSVAAKAAEMKLPGRRFLVTGEEGARIAALRKEGKTNPEIATELGRSLQAMIYRVRVMIACGLLDTRADPVYYEFRFNRPNL